MKLTEMNTAQLAEALADMAQPLGRIARDPALNAAITDLGRFDNATGLEKATALFVPLATAVLRTHREDALQVLSALTGKPAEALAAQPGLETLKEARACLDGELLDFFR